VGGDGRRQPVRDQRPGFALGCIELSHGAVFIAAVGLDPAGFQVRKVAD
jgi:hypothetical protein